MTINKIMKEIKERINFLENKKSALNLREMEADKRIELKKQYNNELDKLYKMQ